MRFSKPSTCLLLNSFFLAFAGRDRRFENYMRMVVEQETHKSTYTRRERQTGYAKKIRVVTQMTHRRSIKEHKNTEKAKGHQIFQVML
ncbi:hypothetical protein KP509_01G066600 [Ceratopteris richardii]|uniref:Secreted protein n=1 Tax=Ceratopteris richardii TaxID=49495 RepID=A0A8T2VH37_CERRI|nr:hypothetical protein KP509_01G066600 [Ceratopteris richardii]